MKEESDIFPYIRERRLRSSKNIRELVAETSFKASNLMLPIFIISGEGKSQEIQSMPEIRRETSDIAVDNVGKALDLGIKSFLLFGIPDAKDELGTGAYDKNGVIPLAIRIIKKEYPEAVIAADVCLCEYTIHGHCGIVKGGIIDNDTTLPLLSEAALAYARAGADIVAPSSMMDGQVKAIRIALNEAGINDTLIMSYSSKFASALYGPFREAAGSRPTFGDRKTYQMDYRNGRQAIREIELDLREGADVVMVKPAMFYMDLISKAKDRFNIPIAAYSVSGEYSMIKGAAFNGWINENDVLMELVYSIKRAGADIIITYYSEKIAEILRSK
ncbi:MAG: porphobilinogen synthase [Nitrososphaerota archaeon]|nr:porphobilinogen synthase [Nitrososphaerota archaeon]MDG7048467.1 porphobilinogen synthase [Nitrososphaerota archaeon]MDG7051548.1 porphobilinogen synthase [Nitrososphaerota archaeon]